MVHSVTVCHRESWESVVFVTLSCGSGLKRGELGVISLKQVIRTARVFADGIVMLLRQLSVY